LLCGTVSLFVERSESPGEPEASPPARSAPSANEVSRPYLTSKIRTHGASPGFCSAVRTS
jgi:hypothetical protein